MSWQRFASIWLSSCLLGCVWVGVGKAATVESAPTAAAGQSLPFEVAPLPPVEENAAVQKVAARKILVWQEPQTLVAQLGELTSNDAADRWGKEVLQLLRKLGPEMSRQPEKAATTLQELQGLAAKATLLETAVRDKASLLGLCRARYALVRRLDVWSEVCRIEASSQTEAQAPLIDPAAMETCLAEIDALLQGRPERAAWEQFLDLAALHDWRQHAHAAQDRVPRALAQAILKRIDASEMSPPQRQFVNAGPVGALQQELLRHVAEAADPGRALQRLERYEQTRLNADARLLAEECRFLALSPGAEYRQLGLAIERHYRNANLRMAVSGELLNRLIPSRAPEYAAVNDTVLGLPVHGQSTTQTQVRVKLLPSPNRLLLSLEVAGRVASLTSATSGPATFINDSDSMYAAHKPMEVDLGGIHLGETQVEVYNETKLRSVMTDFDGIPLFGQLVNGVARSQHEQRQPELSREVKEKVAAQAKERIDAEAGERLGRVASQLQEKVFTPMDTLCLNPTLIAGQTTEERAIARLRLAGRDQLGSCAPRPLSPADSLASVQLDQSAINNVVERLDLDGRSFTLPELSRHFARCLSRPEPSETNPDHDDVVIRFAAKDAVRVRFVEGRVEVSVSIARFAKDKRGWRDFQVRAFYRPEVSGRSAELVRDGIVQLIGPRLSTGAQIILRGVFSRAFSKKTPWSITPQRLATDPKLADLTITQFVIDDGWISVALGRRQMALRPSPTRR